MAVNERINTRRFVTGKSPRIERTYLITGESSESDARTALVAALPSFLGWVVDDISISEEDELWVGNVTWSPVEMRKSDPLEIGGNSQVTISTTGGSETVVAALSQSSFGVGAPDVGGLINWDGETAQGIEITVPALKISATKALANATVTNTLLGHLHDLTGTVNNANYTINMYGKSITFPAGSLKFQGAEVQASEVDGTVEAWQITWNFEARANRTGLTIAGISGVNKQGWQYVWQFSKRQEGAGGAPLPDVQGVYVATVYPSGNFANLGL